MSDSKKLNVSKENDNMLKYHRLFIINLRLLLHDIISNIGDDRNVKIASLKLVNAIESDSLDASKISSIVKKVFTIMGANIKQIEKHDDKIFNIKEVKGDKQVIVTIIPGINLGEAYELYNGKDKLRENLWKYMDNIFYATIKLLEHANPDCLDTNIVKLMSNLERKLNYQEINDELNKKIPDSKLVIKEEFNPFIGVGNNDNNYSLEDMAKSLDASVEEENNSGASSKLGMITSLLGMDKNLDKLTDELKNIDKEQIEKATEDIKKMMGGAVDENTSEMINMMLHDITDELKKDTIGKGNPLNNIVKIAETVAKRVAPKIDPKKINIDTVNKLTKNMSNLGGQFGGGDMFGFIQKTMSKLNSTNLEGKTPDEIKTEQMKMSMDLFKEMGVNMSEDELAKLQKLDPTDITKLLHKKMGDNKDSKDSKEKKTKKKKK
jgi:DNA-binding protein